MKNKYNNNAKTFSSQRFSILYIHVFLAGTSSIAGNNDVGPFIDDRNEKQSRAKQ